MTTAEIVAVQKVGDGVFVEFADGVGSFFSSHFLQMHRESHPNQLFVAEGELAATPSDRLALPLSSREAQPSLCSFLLM